MRAMCRDRWPAAVGLAAAILLVGVISASFGHRCPEDELHHCGFVGHFVSGEAAVVVFLLVLPAALACAVIARLRPRRVACPTPRAIRTLPVRGPPSFPSVSAESAW
ncbi:MAG: hypothetical protein JXP34_22435 [Planctomycetes bacterium]|nr:hypothetical protein [Planctomycetota bacterium]